jgi:hypothetical protein
MSTLTAPGKRKASSQALSSAPVAALEDRSRMQARRAAGSLGMLSTRMNMIWMPLGGGEWGRSAETFLLAVVVAVL